MLLVDDLFQIHAILLPTELGVPKVLVEALIGAAIIRWFVKHRREIRRTHVHLLWAAMIGLVGSITVDAVLSPAPGDSWLVVEAGSMFLGQLAWATYFVVTTRDIGRSVFLDALMTWPDIAYDAAFGTSTQQVNEDLVDGSHLPAQA
jgi:hypothetical protein